MNSTAANRPHSRIFNPTLLIVSLGFFIDCFDLFLFNALRTPSLHDLGLSGEELTKAGIEILNLQVAGMFLGGFLWGILGDKIGRKKALIGSVLLYSLGSLGCAFVDTVPLYAVMRLLTGIGLAGEFGLGAVLAVETVPDNKRSWALGIYTAFSAIAIFAASGLPEFLSWRWCYAVGGIGGLLLLLARVIMFESGLFEALASIKVERGSLLLFLKKPDLLKRWLCCILLIMPQALVTGFLMTLSPEIGKAIGVETPIKANIAFMTYFAAQFIADLMAVVICNYFKCRIRVTFVYLVIASSMVAIYLTLDHPTAMIFYICCGAMGLASFAMLYLFVTVEQFGTNMRATMATSAFSTGRATLIIINLVYLASLHGAGLSVLTSAAYVAAMTFGLGFLSLFGLRETYHQGMDFVEEKVAKPLS